MHEIIARAIEIDRNTAEPDDVIETVNALVQHLLSVSAELQRMREERDMLQLALNDRDGAIDYRM